MKWAVPFDAAAALDSSDEEASDEESGITVDEHATEWYEDEIGVWWVRDPGEEDWSEYVE